MTVERTALGTGADVPGLSASPKLREEAVPWPSELLEGFSGEGQKLLDLLVKSRSEKPQILLHLQEQ